MLIIMSPTKKQEIGNINYSGTTTSPKMLQEAGQVVKALKKFSKNDIANIMKISDSLAKSTYDFFQNFEKQVGKPAIFAYLGDAFKFLDPKSLSAKNLDYAQKHLLILTGLYGILRPLDLMKNYRLEMGVKVSIDGLNNLYDFWREAITNEIKSRLKAEKHTCLINLASKEYSDSVNMKNLSVPAITIEFKEKKGGEYKVVGVCAKRARGTMARYIIINEIKLAVELKEFNELSYKYNSKLSSETNYVFVRG